LRTALWIPLLTEGLVGVRGAQRIIDLQIDNYPAIWLNFKQIYSQLSSYPAIQPADSGIFQNLLISNYPAINIEIKIANYPAISL